MSPVIDIRQVSKTYSGGVQALRETALEVRPGEIFGLLGPNGAGKSTMVKILMTIIRATRCEGTMLGERIGHRATLGRVGYLPEHVQFPRYLSGRQVIELVAGLHKISPKAARAKVDELLELVGMTDRCRDRMGSYSKGMKQRIGIAQSLVNDPEIVFLDEPTDGVDPVGRKEIRHLLLKMRNEGRTVFVNSHLLGELELICDRVAILSQGEVVQQGALKDLLKVDGHYEIDLAPDLSANEPSDPQLRTDLEAMGAEIRGPLEAGATLHFSTLDPVTLQPALDRIRAAGMVVSAMRPVRLSLEELFFESVASPPPVPPGHS